MIKYYVRHCGVISRSLEHEPLCSSTGYFFGGRLKQYIFLMVLKAEKSKVNVLADLVLREGLLLSL